MKLQEGRRSGACTSRDLAWLRPSGDAEQQAHHPVAPQQSPELFGKLIRTTAEQAGRLGADHDLA
jgi:hypothetical protein